MSVWMQDGLKSFFNENFESPGNKIIRRENVVYLVYIATWILNTCTCIFGLNKHCVSLSVSACHVVKIVKHNLNFI